MNAIENAYFAVECRAKPIEPIRRCFLEHLNKSGFHAEAPAQALHVSLCYCQGRLSEEKIEALARELANEKIELKVSGVELLRGLSTPCDYIALTLEESESFHRAKAMAETELPLKKFQGGFKVHVSLLQVPKGALDDIDFTYLNAQLAELARPFCLQTLICGEALSVFDENRTCRFQFPLGLKVS